MAISSYLVIAGPGSKAAVQERLEALPNCEVVPAEAHDVLILVTETTGRAEEDALRGRLEALEGVQALMQTFGEVEAA